MGHEEVRSLGYRGALFMQGRSYVYPLHRESSFRTPGLVEQDPCVIWKRELGEGVCVGQRQGGGGTGTWGVYTGYGVDG